MKKALYILLAILVLGGITYALTQTSLLKGNFMLVGDYQLGDDLKEVDATALKEQILKSGVEMKALDTTVLDDMDGDGLPDDLEATVLGTSWTLADTDGDTIDDGKELNKTNTYVTDPTLYDTDGGGVDDGTEIKTNRTNPLDGTDDVAASGSGESTLNFYIDSINASASTIGDFTASVCTENLSSYTGDMDPNTGTVSPRLDIEVTDPTNSALPELGFSFDAAEGCQDLDFSFSSSDFATSGDYIFTLTADYYEAYTESDETDNTLTETITFEGTATVTDDDTDDDGLTDVEEASLGTDPNVQDSDEDGLSDGYEVYRETPVLTLDFTIKKSQYAYKEEPTLPYEIDTDFDGLTDGEEYYEKTNPLEIDTDGGGIDDFTEVKAGTDPLDASDDVDDSGVVATYYCTDLTVDPETYTVTSEDEDVEFDIAITLNGSGEPSLSSKEGWTGTLVIETEGSGLLSDSNGNEGAEAVNSAGNKIMALKIDVTYADLTETITYKGGSDGDEITAYIKSENCADSLIVAVDIEGEALACTSLDIVPDTYTLPTGETKVDFTVEVKANGDDSSWTSFIKNLFTSLLTFTVVEEENVWSGTLIIGSDSEGDGSFSNDVNGNTGNPIPVSIKETSNTVSVTYENAAAGETITASIEGEEGVCSDTLTLEAEEVAVEEEESYTCTSLELSPSSWDIATDGTSTELTIKNTSDGEKWEGKLVVTTDGAGTLANYEGGSGSSLDFKVLGLEDVTYLTYSDAVAGETITASVEGDEESCTKTLTISETVAEEDEEEEVVAEEEEVVAEEEEEEEVASSTIDENSDLNDILISSAKEVNCDEPYTDVDEEDWEWAYVVLHTCGGIVSGLDKDTFGPSKNMTKAEAIKVLMGLAGHDESEGEDLDLDFVDENIQYHWARDWMAIAQDEDVIRVRDGELFYPDAPITRGQLMLYMVRTAGQTLYGWDEDDIPFSDLSKSSPYTYAIIIGNLTLVKETWAGETWTKGYIRDSWVEDYSDEYTPLFEGYSDGTSGATDYIARSEAMALALRFYLAYYAE